MDRREPVRSMPLLAATGEALAWLRARVPAGATLRIDSRQVGPGDAFIAWPGAAADGRAHVRDAVARGAAACLVEHAGAERFDFGDSEVAAVAGLKAATGPLADAWFGHPSRELELLAVTGTNGKTSTAWWLAQALTLLSKEEQGTQSGCAVIGTLGTGIPPADVVANGLTTPDPVLLHRELRRFADAGLGACAIEASSIGIAEHRLDGCRIRTALFTNFTHDHLDYHGSMDAYWRAKEALFGWDGLRAAVVNVDDPAGAALARRLAQAGALDLWTVSCAAGGAEGGPDGAAPDAPAARLRARDIAWAGGGLRCVLEERPAPGEGGSPRTAVLQAPVIGRYNVSNLLGVVGALRARGVPLADAARACAALAPVPGRLECATAPGAPLVAVDYAHTPDALVQVLEALRPLAAERGGRLTCVFGCGGGRDPAKRPRMAEAALRGADRVVVTTDNPRHEAPQAIVDQVLQGAAGAGPDRLRVRIDRADAIARTLAEAAPQDVVLVAGKGHEDYQDIAGARHPFSDMAQVRAALARRRDAGLPDIAA
ncbi:MAG: UDP-N-acetylmuramoyl-L-alanyl-D-glutamate--2,6-diaminopimelate ligase [Xylophilus ampelinus]